MITLFCENQDLQPQYQTNLSAGADLHASIDAVIDPGQQVCIPTGTWLKKVDTSALPKDCIPELQIRARSGLAFKYGITLTNGVGTIDADYKDEICVLLWNTGKEVFKINAKDRIAQLVVNLVYQVPEYVKHEQRTGGFGSTSTFTSTSTST